MGSDRRRSRAARAGFDALELQSQRVAGIAKQFEELYPDPEKESTPLRFAADSPALRVIQQIRDEAHRFAPTYHRKLRTQKIRESILAAGPDISPKMAALIHAALHGGGPSV